MGAHKLPGRAVLLLVLAFSSTAMAQNIRPLQKNAWSERAFGISMREPQGIQRLPIIPGSDVLLRLKDDREGGLFNVLVMVRHTAEILTIDEVEKEARRQISQTQSGSKVLHAEVRAVAGREALVLLARVPQADMAADRFVAQCIVPVERNVYVLLELVSDFDARASVEPLFDAMVATLALADPNVLDELRKREIRYGERWRMDLTLSQIRAALVTRQVFRMLQGEKDTGWLILDMQESVQDEKNGVQIVLRSFRKVDEFRVDTLAEFFLSNDDTYEKWSKITTQRPLGSTRFRLGALATALEPTSETHVETGFRRTYVRDDPVGPKRVVELDITSNRETGKKDYILPATGYLSQVESWLMGALLPHDIRNIYGFYFYNAEAKRVTYRTEEVIPTLGGFTVLTRMAPNMPVIRTTYERNGRMIERQLPDELRSDALRLVPVSIEQLQLIWP